MESDPSGALAWLVSELEAAESAGERVWILGHMPLGTTDAFHDQSEYFGKTYCRIEKAVRADLTQIRLSKGLMLQSRHCSSGMPNFCMTRDSILICPATLTRTNSRSHIRITQIRPRTRRQWSATSHRH